MWFGRNYWARDAALVITPGEEYDQCRDNNRHKPPRRAEIHAEGGNLVVTNKNDIIRRCGH